MLSEYKYEREPNKTPSLTKKVVSGAKWVFAGRLAARAVEFIKAIVLARLLVPEDFGLFALVMLAVLVLDIFSQTGINAALIQHKGNTHEYLDTAWTIQVLRGFILALILYTTAPLVGWFFNDIRIVQLLKVVSIVPVIQGFIHIGIIFFQKELEFHKQFLYDITSSLISLIVGITLAYILHSVWALIWASVTLSFSRLVMSYLIFPYRLRIKFINAQAKQLYNFGKWITAYNILLFLCQQIDKIVIGKVLGPIALGVYQIAQRIADLPSSQIAVASINFTFPTYSKIYQDKERLRSAFLDILEIIMSLILPISVFLFFAGPDIIYGLLGEKWKDSILPLRLLSIVGFLTAFDTISTPLFMSVGSPNIEFWKNLLKLSFIAVSIYPLTFYWGLAGTCISLMISSVAILPIWAKAKSLADLGWQDIFLRLSSPFILGLTTVLPIILIHTFVARHSMQSLVIAAVSSGIFYMSATIIIGRVFNRGIYMHIPRIIKNI